MYELLAFVYVLSYSVMSHSLQPHGLYPGRLLCPWDSPGKNAGIDCHFLLQGIFPTQGLSPHLWCLLHYQVDSLPLSHLGILTSCLQNEWMDESINEQMTVLPNAQHSSLQILKLRNWESFAWYIMYDLQRPLNKKRSWYTWALHAGVLMWQSCSWVL